MKHVSIEIIQKCPNYCMHCSSISGITCEKIIKFELLRKVFDGLAEIKVDELSISGGEPFLHKDLAQIVKYGKEKGFNINIYTSGIMLDENGQYISLKEDLIKQLSEYGVKKLIFNVQSLKENVYDKIMGTEGNLKLLMKSIECSKENGIYTELHFVPMKLNYTEIKDVVHFVESEGLDRVSFLGLIPHGRAKQNKKELYLDKETNIRVKELLHSLEGENVRVGIPLKLESSTCICNAGREKLYVKFDGRVYGCEAFKYIDLFDEKGNKIEPDSIYKNEIFDIFKNSQYLNAAKIRIHKIFEKNNLHENCPVQEELREHEER